MGDRRKQGLRVQFDGKLRLEFHGARITSDAGLLAFRELDEAFRLTEKGSTGLSDSRRGKNIGIHQNVDLLLCHGVGLVGDRCKLSQDATSQTLCPGAPGLTSS